MIVQRAWTSRSRVEAALNHQEPDRVPLAEAAIDYKIMSQFLGHPVLDEDVASQVEFWTKAGYDYALFTVGLMRPGGVTQDSQISKVIQDTLAKEDVDEEAWNVWKKARIHIITPAFYNKFAFLPIILSGSRG